MARLDISDNLEPQYVLCMQTKRHDNNPLPLIGL
jgi:hypothetical protein